MLRGKKQVVAPPRRSLLHNSAELRRDPGPCRRFATEITPAGANGAWKRRSHTKPAEFESPPRHFSSTQLWLLCCFVYIDNQSLIFGAETSPRVARCR
jgi:hypothetical protein